MTQGPKQFRVKMIIYDADGYPDNPEVTTDEPLLSHEDEIAVQAYDTLRKFRRHLETEQ
jgi:hypothetical protein